VDFYIILGIERGATSTDIKRAYKRLARKYHPDINPGDRMAEAQFRQIAEAYETLSDPGRRQQYDTVGFTSVRSEDVSFGFEGFDFSVTASGAAASTFGDLFADVFRHRDDGGRQDAAERGADLHHTLSLTFDEAIRGGEHTVTVLRQAQCRTCHGRGWTKVMETRCPHCHGSGIVKSARGHMVFSKPCTNCNGTGRLGQSRCPSCAGQQVETRSETLTLRAPAGLADGARIRIPGKGHVGRNGGEDGDLYVTVRVEPHPIFRREGDDLHITIPIAVHEAALGAKIEVPALDGIARVRVPPGTQTGQRFRLRERGVPSSRDGRRGDLVVEVRLVLPKILDERSKELLREFGQINAEDVRKSS
jgi:molecular chaperone DnaJ